MKGQHSTETTQLDTAGYQNAGVFPHSITKISFGPDKSNLMGFTAYQTNKNQQKTPPPHFQKSAFASITYFNSYAQLTTACDRVGEPQPSTEASQKLSNKFWLNLLPLWHLRVSAHACILRKSIYPIKFGLSLKDQADMNIPI